MKRQREPHPDLFRLQDLQGQAWFRVGVLFTGDSYRFNLRRRYNYASLTEDDDYWHAIRTLAGLCAHFGVSPGTVLERLWNEATKLDRRVQPRDLLSFRTRRIVEQASSGPREDPSRLIACEMESFSRQFDAIRASGVSDQEAVRWIADRGYTSVDIVYAMATIGGATDLASRCEPLAQWCWKLEPLRGKHMRGLLGEFQRRLRPDGGGVDVAAPEL